MVQYYVLKLEVGNVEYVVKFGIFGYCGSVGCYSFNELYILVIVQVIVEEWVKNGIIGFCYVGKDIYVFLELVFIFVLEVLVVNGVDVIVQENNGFMLMFVVLNVILVYNKKGGLLVDGIVIMLLYNLLEDGGIKYNLFNGGLVDINVIKVVEDCVNVLLVGGL